MSVNLPTQKFPENQSPFCIPSPHCRLFKTEYPRLGMRCREKRKRVGDVLPVKDSYHYPLPPGLSPGTRVKLVAYSCGYWTVEASGELYRVFGPLVDAGFEYEIQGRWYPATDPRVIERKKEETLGESPAYSRVNGDCLNSPV